MFRSKITQKLYIKNVLFQSHSQSMNEQNPDQQFPNQPHILKEINITTQYFGVATPNLAYKILGQWVFIWV